MLIPLMRSSVSLLCINMEACHRVHLHSRCKMICEAWNIRSHSTCSLKRSATDTLATLSGSGAAQSLHCGQVSTMSLSSRSTSADTPAGRRIFTMAAHGLCHHRICSLRRSLRLPPSSDALMERIVLPTSNSLHSEGLGGPDALSA